MHDGVKTARRSSLRVVNLVGQEWTLGATNWRSSSGEVSNNNCDGRRSTDDLGQLITPSVHLRVQDDARETARRAGPSATADTRFPRRRIDTARTVCAAGSMKLSSVRLSVPPRPSVCSSVPSFGRRAQLRRVCCCGPGDQELSIDRCTACAQQQTRAVSRCQLAWDAELVLLTTDRPKSDCEAHSTGGQISRRADAAAAVAASRR